MSELTTVLGAFGSILKDREKIALLPAIAATATSLAANPTMLNLQAQGGLFLAKALAAQPGILQGELADLAGFLSAIASQGTASAVMDLTGAEKTLAAAAAGQSTQAAPSPLAGS